MNQETQRPSLSRWQRVAGWVLFLSYAIGSPIFAIVEAKTGVFSERFNYPPEFLYFVSGVQFICALTLFRRAIAPWSTVILTVLSLGAVVAHVRINSVATALPALIYTAIQVWYGSQMYRQHRDEIRIGSPMTDAASYPDVLDASLVGSYPALAKAGGGYVWDEVLEYRVWCCPSKGAKDLEDGNDYYCAFAGYAEALEFSKQTTGADEPLALILQREFIDEPEPGQYIHMKEERITEWPVTLLSRPRRNERTIPDFLSPDAPPNRLDILRGLA